MMGKRKGATAIMSTEIVAMDDQPESIQTNDRKVVDIVAGPSGRQTGITAQICTDIISLKGEASSVLMEQTEPKISAACTSTSLSNLTVPPPSPRSHMTLTPHPLKDALIMFGGELQHGSKVTAYNDLFIYDISSNQWSQVKTDHAPSPRSSHQACAVKSFGGQLWVFGGESSERSKVKHHRDLWVCHLNENKWEHVRPGAGPSARSGHRMVEFRRHLIIFGGFTDNNKSFHYFNDIHAFSLDDFTWTQIKPTGNGPCPRSACQVGVVSDKYVVIYGGYSRVHTQKDSDKGTTHSDMFTLTPKDGLIEDEGKSRLPEQWEWSPLVQCGELPTPRVGMTWIQTPGNRTVAFGGVYDEVQSEDSLQGRFFNDLYMVDLVSGQWYSDIIRTKALTVSRKRRHCETEDQSMTQEPTKSDTEIMAKRLRLTASINNRRGVALTSTPSDAIQPEIITETSPSDMDIDMFAPPPRMNSSMALKGGQLYVFGGFIERGDRQHTLNDFYALDLYGLRSWRVIIPPVALPKESETDASSGSDGDSETSDGETGDETDDMEDDSINFDDAEKPRSNERMKPYVKRTNNYWLQKARQSSTDSPRLSDRRLQKIANEMAAEFYNNSQ